MGFAHSLPAGSNAREALLYAAPTISIVTGGLAYYIEVLTVRFLQQRFVNSLRKRLALFLSNPHTSDEHKEKLKRKMEELEEALVLQEIETVKLSGTRFSSRQ